MVNNRNLKINDKLICIGLLIFTSMVNVKSLKSQSISADSNNKNWLMLMQDHTVPFATTQKAFYQYWANRSDHKGNGYKIFKRWEYINEYRVMPNGKLQAPGYAAEVYENYMAKEKAKIKLSNRSSSGTWSLLGPNAYFTNNTGQPTGMGRTTMVAFHPTNTNILFVGTPSGGIWKSTNNGSSWSSISSNLPMLGVSSIVVHPSNADTIYIGTGDRDADDAPGIGVYRTVNGGITWEKLNTGMGNVTVGCLHMHPSNNNILLAATSAGIYRTTNGGKTWTLSIAGNFKDLKFNPFNPQQVYATKIATVGEFYRSVNNGVTWTRITNGVPNAGARLVVGVSRADASKVYIIQTTASESLFSALLRSTDSGVSFTTMSTTPNILDFSCNGSGSRSQANYDLCITVDPTNADVVYCGAINNWKSTDGGATWNIISHWVGTAFSGSSCAPSVHADQHEYNWSPHNGNLYVANDGGLYFTTNGGSSWVEITNNLGIGQNYKLGQSVTNVNVVLSGLQDNGSSATINNGGTFFTTSGGDGMETLVDYNNANFCYNTYHSGLIRRSTTGATGGYNTIAENGLNGINETGGWVTPYFLHKSTPTTMFVGNKNVWRSTNVRAMPNSSVLFEPISSSETNNCIALEQSPVNLNIMYAVRNASIKRTSNANATASAVTWIPCALPNGYTPTDIKADYWDSNTIYASANFGVYKSTDKGMTWNDISSNLPPLFTNCIVLDKNNPGAIYVGNQTSVWYKNNSVTDWILFSTGLPPVDIRELEIYYDASVPANSRIRAATYGLGIWTSDLAEISVLNPQTIAANTLSTTQINLSWTKNTVANDVILAVSSTGIFGSPAEGINYSNGSALPGGGTVIYVGSASSLNHTGLSPHTKYYYKIWSVNSSLKYSAGLPVISGTTLGFNWTAGAGTSNWFTPGNWGNNKVPEYSDDVMISASAPFQPQINAAGAICGSIVIEAGASLSMNAVTAYTLSIGGNFTNNGTFNSGVGIVEFNNLENQTIDGASTTNFHRLRVSKSLTTSVLEVKSLINLTATGVDPLILSSGTFKLSSASSITPFRNSVTLQSGSKFWNNGGTVTFNSSLFLDAGILHLSSGTLNIGSAANHFILYLNNGQLLVDGGTLTLAGPYRPNSSASIGTYNQTGGTVIINTMGSTNTTRGMFEINPSASFVFTGGTIQFQRSSSNAAPNQDVMILATSNIVNGGTLQFGNSSSASAQRFRLRSTCVLPNFSIHGAFPHSVSIQTNAPVFNGNISLGTGDTLTTNNLPVQIQKNLENNGFFNSRNSWVTFNGSSLQTVSGNSLTFFKKLALNNVNGIELTGSNSVQIDSILKIDTGSIKTNNNMIIIADDGLIYGAGDKKFINGFCRKIGNDAFTFPVGKGTVFAPISIAAPSASTDHFTASYYLGSPHSSYDTSQKMAPLNRISGAEYWILDRTNGSSSVPVTLSWNAQRSEAIGNVSDLLVARWNGSTWVSEGSASTLGNLTQGSITSNAVSSFSPFSIGSSAVPLSARRLSLTQLAIQNATVNIQWDFQAERENAASFSIERSNNAQSWQEIGRKSYQVNPNSMNTLSYLDLFPIQNGVIFYRIKHSNSAGLVAYSQIRNITLGSEVKLLSLNPNPCVDLLFLNTEETEFLVEISDADGKLVLSRENSKVINVENLKNGVYFCKFIDKLKNTELVKFIVMH